MKNNHTRVMAIEIYTTIQFHFTEYTSMEYKIMQSWNNDSSLATQSPLNYLDHLEDCWG